MSSDQMQEDSFYKAASLLSGYELREHFEAWSVPIFDAVKCEIEHLSLPLPPQNILEINLE